MLDTMIEPALKDSAGIAMSMPGRIDLDQGIVVSAGSFPFLRNMPLRPMLQARYRRSVSVNNDGKCAAIAEQWKGSMRHVQNGLVYVIGAAIGGGIIINGQVVKGPHFLAGELSNCIIDKNLPGFSRENIAARKGGAYGMLLSYRNRKGMDGVIDGKSFFDSVLSHEPEAESVFLEFCRFTASFLFSLQMALDFERIAIGGGISAQPCVISGIRAELHAMYNAINSHDCVGLFEPEVTGCQFGNDANLIGALKCLLNER